MCLGFCNTLKVRRGACEPQRAGGVVLKPHDSLITSRGTTPPRCARHPQCDNLLHSLVFDRRPRRRHTLPTWTAISRGVCDVEKSFSVGIRSDGVAGSRSPNSDDCAVAAAVR